MRRFRLVSALALLMQVIGCGDKNPTAPTGPAVTGLTITGADAVLTGVSTTYTATLSADGTSRPVTPVWISSNPEVATVDSAGRLEGRAHASTTLSASSGGQRATKTVQVVNNYGGTWEGSYVIRACADTGDLTDHDGGWCLVGPGRVGSVSGIRMTLVQSGQNLSEITATIGSFGETITGIVSPDGRLNLGGTLTLHDFDYPDIIIATAQLSNWNTRLEGADGMTGRWSEDLTSLVFRIGTAHTDNELATMKRISKTAGGTSAR
jgi:hypothetical protein